MSSQQNQLNNEVKAQTTGYSSTASHRHQIKDESVIDDAMHLPLLLYYRKGFSGKPVIAKDGK